MAMLLMYRMWATQMHETEVDKEWWRRRRHYIRNEDEKVPTVGRFNGGQKLLFWGFFWCGILLLLSGLVLWFPHSIPWNLRYLRYIAVLVHACCGSDHDRARSSFTCTWARRWNEARSAR